jgi:hypothetical protein
MNPEIIDQMINKARKTRKQDLEKKTRVLQELDVKKN